MPKVKLDFGATLDVLNKDELGRELDAHAERAQLARARGKKHFRIPVMRGSAASGALLLGGDAPGDAVRPGPREGYAWAIRRLAVNGLAAADVVGIYRNSNANPWLWQISGSKPYDKWGWLEMVLLGGEVLCIASIGAFTSTAEIIVNGEADEIPEAKLFELV
jgi:hypothetical protein